MKTTLSTIIGSALLATGFAVSLIAAPAQANPGGSSSSNAGGNSSSNAGGNSSSNAGGNSSANAGGNTGGGTVTPPASSFTLGSTQTFNFANILGGDTVGDGIVSQFNLNVSETDTNQVLFQFVNTGSVSSAFISQIQFSDASNLLNFNSFAPAYSDPNVSFEADSKNLAQSKKIANWENSFGFATTSQGSGNGGIDAGEKLGLLFDGNFQSVISALTSNQLTVGMHVQGIGIANGASDTFISGNPENVKVPEPATLAGLGLAFGGMLASRRRKSH
ncbi:PEP-CTERM sorting domain-containing protein [Planktothrix mougeotii]|uniref:PEP-CTERM sorting domain-containing protein n=1 Tax=Planktothrix mougeotii LEGE 06226 TaxID=1828728 RepID=A0ABR9UGC4_9CYAN|nr:PEP-CTERM sorting domain-containing protein [Planktothrix mougeotii]MBE9145522.1 PEP-CTERM sorting domain-containing protein [Planktothrix mougeotii LEGE 06226]